MPLTLRLQSAVRVPEEQWRWEEDENPVRLLEGISQPFSKVRQLMRIDKTELARECIRKLRFAP